LQVNAFSEIPIKTGRPALFGVAQAGFYSRFWILGFQLSMTQQFPAVEKPFHRVELRFEDNAGRAIRPPVSHQSSLDVTLDLAGCSTLLTTSMVIEKYERVGMCSQVRPQHRISLTKAAGIPHRMPNSVEFYWSESQIFPPSGEQRFHCVLGIEIREENDEISLRHYPSTPDA
jgi:hypothetical protein